MTVRVDLNISLDGVVVPEDPMGAEWGRLVAHYTATRTFRERVFHDTSGAGTTGVDDRYGAAYFEGIGAEIMGAGMFGLHTYPDDPDWRGWWGDEPPFQTPVLVLTNRERPPLEFANGTRFEFLATTPEAALERARELAGDADVRIGGGASTVRAFLEGTRLWDGLSDLDLGYTVTSELAESGVVHVTFAR